MTEFNAAPYDPVSPERWAYLKKLKVGPGTMIHTSCEAYMIENTFGKHLPLVPFVAKPGRTYKSPLKETLRAQAKANHMIDNNIDGWKEEMLKVGRMFNQLSPRDQKKYYRLEWKL